MKTTLELPSELMKAIKQRAVEEDRSLTYLITELLQRGLAEKSTEPGVIRNRVNLPLLCGDYAPGSEEKFSPERMAEILLHHECCRSISNRESSPYKPSRLDSLRNAPRR